MNTASDISITETTTCTLQSDTAQGFHIDHDDDGVTDEEKQLTTEAMEAPTASFDISPKNITTADIVYFNSTSNDSDGTITSIQWQFGDGSSGTGPHITHTYNDAGTYKLNLTVTDNDGIVNTTYTTLNIIRPEQYTLSTSVAPSGCGTVSLDPSDGTYNEGTMVTVTADPSLGYQFDHWSDDANGTNASFNITMDSDKTVTAHFTPTGNIYVDDDADSGWYDATHVRTVQEGVSNATAGDTVVVYNGVYHENVVVEKSIIVKDVTFK